MAVKALAYAVIDTADPEAWRRYGEGVVGARAVEGEGDLKLRFDERPFRLLIRKADADRFHAAGWVYGSN